MSGIINSAGSKSGLIGITEQEYEQGEVTNPMVVVSTTVTSYYSQDTFYIRKGNMVTVFVNFDSNNSSSMSGQVKVTLPFTSASHGAEGGSATSSFCMIYNNSGWVSDNPFFNVAHGSAVATLRSGADVTFTTTSGYRIICVGQVQYLIV